MKKDKLFRETPFGGYKRADVLNYIDTADQAHRTAVDELNDRILELNEALANAARQKEALEKELEIKTAYAAEAEALKEQMQEKDAQIEALLGQCQELTTQTDAVVQKCEELTAQLEAGKQGFTCERLQDGVCAAVTEKAEKILNDAAAEANKKISDAEEQASGILLRARIEAQAMMTEAEGQTEALAQQVSNEAHEIITMTVKEAKEIINAAKAQGSVILSDSARSIGKIKGNLSSMQLVVKNIENELKSARETLSENIQKREV
ncbi:MAG: hypothetical protein J6B86_05410 [Clostridia bacterium]|nr:hypothetical protein [Clostridia bacterium]